MNHYQNSINNIIYLGKDTYPCYDEEVYALDADRVNKAYEQGFLPIMQIEGLKNDNRPKIAVILAQDKHPLREEKDFTMHPSYVNAIVAAGGYPIFFAYDKVTEVLENIKPQAILLIGGFFYSPKEWYVCPEENDIDKRGQAYLDALQYAKKHKLPLLGICAGMQMLGGFCGAKINKGFAKHLVGGKVVAHKVKIKPDTLLAQIAGVNKLNVNSHHSEALVANQIGDCIISALAEDGIVEAIELRNPWNDFVLGIQWHPERDFANSEDFRNKLFRTFVNAAK